MSAFFYKEIVSNKFLVKGKPVPFEVLDGNRGVIALEENEQNAETIKTLNESAGRFGIVKISEAEYTEKKTAHPFNPSGRQSPLSERLRVVSTRPPTNPFGRQVGAAAAEAQPVPQSTLPTVPIVPLEPSPFVKELAKPAPPIVEPGAAQPPAQAPAAETTPAAEPAPKFTPATRRISRRADAPATG